MTDPDLYRRAYAIVLEKHKGDDFSRTFADEVDKVVDELEAVKPIVQELCKKACEPPAAEEKKPAEPRLPELPHGLDLEWN